MLRVLVFFLTRTLKNSVRSRLKRLRQLKYLISGLAGFAYLYFFFLRNVVFQRTRRGSIGQVLDPEMFPMFEAIIAFGIFAAVLLPWLWPAKGEGVKFTEPEIQFLFPAPFRRRDLLFFRIAKGQMGIIFGVLVSAFFIDRGGFVPHGGFLLVTLWIIYTFLGLYSMGTSLAKMSLAQNGVPGLRRQLGVLAVAVSAIVSVLVWVKWFIPPPPDLDSGGLRQMASWLTQVSNSGPAFYFLLPFRALVRPVFSADPLTFVERLVPALLIVWLVYLWVIRSDTQFEESSMEQAEKTARALEAAKKGSPRFQKLKPGKVRSVPFRLSPSGPPFWAVFWKNLIGTGRINARVLAVVLAGAVLAIAMATRNGGGRQTTASLIGGFAFALTGFLLFVGPVMLRQDLRSDLPNIEVLKALPLPGWSVVLGEVLAPVVVLTCAEWFLLLIAAFAMPSMGNWDRALPDRAAVFAGAAILVPCLSAAGVVVQNAAVLVMPSWIQLGSSNQRGIEAMGQRLVTMAATMIVLVFALLPAAILFGVVFLLGFRALGTAVLPAAALLAAVGLIVEIGIGVFLLGALYDRFDASEELLG